MSCTSPAPWWRTPSKRRFDCRFGLPKNFAAPNQHRPFWDLRWEPGNTAPPPLPVRCFHIHSKTACRGASACQWHASYEPTGAERRPSPSAPATKPAETLRFCRFSFYMCCMVMVFTLVQTSSFCIHLHLSATVLIPSSTQNAPGFAFFGSIRVRFLVFCPFGRAKFLALLLCTLPHSVYRLKSLVIPVRREVSFLT